MEHIKLYTHIHIYTVTHSASHRGTATSYQWLTLTRINKPVHEETNEQGSSVRVHSLFVSTIPVTTCLKKSCFLIIKINVVLKQLFFWNDHNNVLVLMYHYKKNISRGHMLSISQIYHPIIMLLYGDERVKSTG